MQAHNLGAAQSRGSFISVFAFLLVSSLALPAQPAGAASVPEPAGKPGTPGTAVGNLDVRVHGAGRSPGVPGPASHGARRSPAQSAARAAAWREGLARLQSAAPGAEVRLSPLSGGAELVRSRRGALTEAAPGRPGEEIVRGFLRDHRGLFGLAEADLAGLRFKGESTSRRSGLRLVRFEQTVGGVPVFGSDTRVTLDREGRVLRLVGLVLPEAGASVPVSAGPAALAPRVTPEQALVTAMRSVGIELAAGGVRSESASPGDATGANDRVVLAGDPRIRGKVASQLVYFPLAPGVLVPAWRQVAFTGGPGDWATVVDAGSGPGSGQLLWRKNLRSSISTQEARFGVYVQSSDGTTPTEGAAPHSPTDVVPGSGTQFPTIPRAEVPMSAIVDLFASPNGWIPDGGSTTTGNNADAYLDTDGDNLPDAGLLDNDGRPVGNLDEEDHNRDFLGAGYAFDLPPVAGDPDAGTDPGDPQFQRGSVTQLFYLTNWFHDRLHQLGFDEAAGNFQTSNFGRGGAGGDAVLAEAQDGAAANNATFTTPPDGGAGLMQISLFTFPALPRDASFDAAIVLHELAHGVTGRLLGDGLGLLWDVGGAMSEGWSDFYALALLFGEDAFPPDEKYAFANYALYGYRGRTDNYLYGFRRYPYSSDKTVNPLTFADVDDVTLDISGGIAPSTILWSRFGGLEVHNAGEIWANTLWDVRNRIIADPAGADGDVAGGNEIMLQIVTDALKMTPANPSFVDSRDALLDADCATNSCANEASIWGGFANRGLGYGAVAPLAQDGVTFIGAYVGIGESFELPHLDVDGWTIDDAGGNSDGAVDPGEPVRLAVELLNPWRSVTRTASSVAATLTTSTPGVTILTGGSTYPVVPAQGSATGTPFIFTLDPSAVCGQSIHFTLTVTSALGTSSSDFTVRVGTRAGTGTPLVFTRETGGLAIPDNSQRGVRDLLTIADDLEIADLDLRIDDLPHTFTSDVVVGLRAPWGYGTTLIFRRGFFLPDGDGDNFVDTVIDGGAADDLNQSGAADAPYTGAWLPAFNSPVWSLFGLPDFGPDAVDQLSRLNGRSTLGDWHLQVADEGLGETGQLNSWSLIVTPAAFTCAAVPTQAAVSGTKTASGSFVVGGAVSYTVTLRNQGTLAQADNPGDEFTDVLPATLELVSASATSGTAAANLGTNTVTWNGALPAVVGEVVITINATVGLETAGQVIANQGAFSFDADGDGINESAGVTDDPATPAVDDPTAVVVTQSVVEIPTLSELGFLVLCLLLGGAGFLILRR
jgi:uncharacterized repeat protein (TIGR01451 family)